MLWFRQLPFLAVLVFGIGTGIGFAWKTGWIPVEYGEPHAGHLSDDDSAAGSIDDPLETPLAAADSPSEVAAVDSDVFSAQSEPHPAAVVPGSPLAPVAPVQPVRQPVVSHRLVPASHATTDEPEWATARTETPSNPRQAKVIPASPPKPGDVARHADRPIRLASNQESLSAAPGEPAGNPPTVDPPPSDSPLAAELKEIDELIAREEILAAHRALSKLYWNHRDARDELQERLNTTSRAIFFEPRPHFVEPYVVQANDQLRVIANRYQVSWEYLAKLNQTDPRRIQLGQKLKVLKGPFSAIIDLRDFALTVHLQGYYVKRYDVGIGKDGSSPIGKFAVLNKIENPQYTGPDGKVIPGDDPANPLGERWIDLGESYGIHGTIEPDSIGKAASRGCIRMRAKDVIEVYDFLVNGSEVVIRK